MSKPCGTVSALSPLTGCLLLAVWCAPLGVAEPAATAVAKLKERYTLVMADEFDGVNKDGTGLDLAKWKFEGSSVHRNGEKQVYADTEKDGNVWVKDGFLTIEARKEDRTIREKGAEKVYNYTSGAIDSVQTFAYGIFEMRAKLPDGAGTWPAFWMLGEDRSGGGRCVWPFSGEIDIMEVFVNQGAGKNSSTLHHTFTDTKPTEKKAHKATHGGLYELENKETFKAAFHTFGAIWTETTLQFYLDDVVYGTMDLTQENLDAFTSGNKFFMLLNLALGGGGGGKLDDAIFGDGHNPQFIVDYVRVYQKAAGSNPVLRNFAAKDCSPTGSAEPKAVKTWSLNYGTVVGIDRMSVGNHLELTLPAVEPGTYEAYAVTRDAPSRGLFQASIGGTNLGAVVDCSTGSTLRNHRLGTITVTGGKADIPVRFTCTTAGTGTARTGICLDVIALVDATGKADITVPVAGR